ncbi:Flagellar hook-length control protein FliK [Chitinispirillum alkaliphilum]|nr:Flagellar hook-length control protein FliK [Chitinispirillum alkaliphilum]
MRSDAILFSFSADHTGSKNRMDRTQSSRRPEDVQGFGERKGQKDCRFSNLYERIANENKTANHSARSSKSANEGRKVTSEQSLRNREPENSLCSDKKTENSKQAVELIKASLLRLSAVFNLSVNENFNDLSEEAFCCAAAEQFAEMLWALKNIGAMLENALDEGTGLELGSIKLDSQEIGFLLKTVQQEKFHLELGFTALGIGAEVQEQLALNFESNTVPGIHQAVNPSELELSGSEAKRIFGHFTQPVKEELEGAIARIKALIGGGQSEDAQLKVQNAPVMEPKMDSAIMRALLKIDTHEKVASENKESAAVNESLKMPEVIDLALAKSPDSVETEEMQIAQFSISSDNGNGAHSTQSAKLESVLSRISDESMVKQIAQRMQNAVRSGVHELRIQLRPESLGDVHLSIRMEGEVVSARIQVENSQVKQIIENNLQMLKDALEEQNLNAGAFSVDVSGGNEQDAERLWQQVSETQEGAVAVNAGKENDVQDTTSREKIRNGIDTGRRYGNNSMEYFA